MRRLIDNHPGSSRTAPAISIAGTYGIKAIDAAGNQSANAIFVNAPKVPGGARLRFDEQAQHPTFPGRKVGLSVVGGALSITRSQTAATSPIFSDIASMGLLPAFKTAAKDEFLLGGGTYETGVFSLDNGTFLVRCEADMRISNISELSALLERRGTLDAWGIIQAGVSVEDFLTDTQIRTATTLTGSGSDIDLDYNWGAWEDFIVGDYEGRYFQGRLKMRTFDPNISPLVDELSYLYSIANRTVSGSGTSPLRINFDPAFYQAPVITPTGNLQNGERFRVAESLRNTALIQVFNSSNTEVTGRTIYWSATGPGEQVT